MSILILCNCLLYIAFAIGIKRVKLSAVVFFWGEGGGMFCFVLCLLPCVFFVCVLFSMLYCTKKDFDIYRGSSIDY